MWEMPHAEAVIPGERTMGLEDHFGSGSQRNERIKLAASFWNNVGAGMVIVGMAAAFFLDKPSGTWTKIAIAIGGFLLGWLCYSIASNMLTYLHTPPEELRLRTAIGRAREEHFAARRLVITSTLAFQMARDDYGFVPADDRFPKLLDWLTPHHRDLLFRYREGGKQLEPPYGFRIAAKIALNTIAGIEPYVRGQFLNTGQATKP
jgi:hypothetical protein